MNITSFSAKIMASSQITSRQKFHSKMSHKTSVSKCTDFLVGFLAFIFTSVASDAQVFQTTSSFPTARYAHATAPSNNDNILIFGGVSASGSNISSVYEYSTANNTWSGKASIPNSGGLSRSACVKADSNTIYLFGGSKNGAQGQSDKIFKYNIAQNTWQVMRSLPDGIGREQLQATQMNDSTIFLSGGLSVISGSLIYQNTCYTYNTKKDTCIFAGELPNGAINHSASLLPNGEVLITGGFDGSAAHNHVTVFNLLSGLRTISTNLSTGVSSHTAVRAGGKVYIYGGFNIPAFTYSNELHVYDSETDSLYLLANGPYGCSQQAMVSFGNSILIAGGNKLLDNGSVGVTSEAYLFNIQTNEFTPLSPMPSQRSEMSLAPIGNSGKFLFSGGHISASEPYNTGIIYDANLTLKANSPEQKEALKIHSDPAGNQIFIKAGLELLQKKYTIFDVRGKTLREGMLNETQTRISTLEFTPGVYLISIDGKKSARFLVDR
jgi:hypothetical protein